MARVLVLGAGFGGIATAVALRSQLAERDEIVLVDRRADFVMGLRKTWYVLGISPMAYGERRLDALAQRGIAVRQGEIERIEPEHRAAEIDGERLEADALVIALGASHAPDQVPGLVEHGFNVWSREGLEHAQAAVGEFRGGRVLVGVFGLPHSCPPAPYELALLLADRLDDRGVEAEVAVFSPAPITLPIVGAAGCMPLDARLADRGIAFHPGHVASGVRRGLAEFTDADALPFDLLLGVPPHRAPSVLVDAGMADPNGWVRTDPRTLETRHAGVYAIGDCTAISLSNGMPLPKAGLFAQRAGEVVAARIASLLAGETPSATFDGSGACFIEMGGGEASMIRGDFYADPPAVELTAPTAAQRLEKERFESERLTAWFGA